MINLFINTFKAPYFEYLVGSSAQYFYDLVAISVLKPGPARRVDPGPGRPGPGTGPGGGKNPLRNWPRETRSTRDPVHPV